MISYSQSLSRRARVLGLGLVLALALAGAWQYRHQPQDGQTLFRPEGRIAQVVELAALLKSPPGPEAPTAAPPCESRPLRVLQARLVAALGLTEAEAERYLRLAAGSADWPDCSGFSQAWSTVLRIHRQDPTAPMTAERIAQSLTEDVSWSRRLPCLLGGSAQAPWLLAGPALECGMQGRFQTLASLPPQSSFRGQVGPLAQAASSAALTGRWNPESAQWLTLRPDFQARLDRWQGCLGGRRCEQAPDLAGLKNLSIVVLDARSGQLLGSWCEGPACERARQQGPGVLASALMEAPPASTAKLLFSLVLAQGGDGGEALQRQIKTSGQTDASVSKRNEWWEKQVICDGRSGPCSVPEEADRLGAALGLNAHCGPPRSAACGRWGLLWPPQHSLLPGQLGRLVLPDGPRSSGPMMDWKTYDDIRQGRRKPQPSRTYERTALTVQAVIGGGDSRTSALGAAALPMQVWRLSQGLAPVLPSLLQSPQPPTLEMPSPARDWGPAARVVLAGMRKVVEPAEPGWQGAGTAAAAVERAMGQPCRGDCGLWAKTGTVSRQDRVFGGTTLLSALVDANAWARWMGQPLHPELANRTLALGVVAMPGAGAPGGHAAGQVGMQALRLLLSQESPP